MVFKVNTTYVYEEIDKKVKNNGKYKKVLIGIYGNVNCYKLWYAFYNI